METPEELAQRKSIFMARATSHFDSPKLRREASKMFDKANGIKRKSLLARVLNHLWKTK